MRVHIALAIVALGACKADTSLQATHPIPARPLSTASAAPAPAGASMVASDGVDGDAGRNDDEGASSDAGVAGSERLRADVRLRDLVVELSGMEDDRNRFMQFRLIPEDETFAVICVIHEGLRDGEYELRMPRALLVGEAYRLDFWVDHDGSGGYDAPPIDHAWRVEIPSRGEAALIRFEHNNRYVHIEDSPPVDDRPLILSAHGMYGYVEQLFDVQVTESLNGRLVGRQIREVPGDSFDVTVASVVHDGVAYRVDLFIDANANGAYDAEAEIGWRLESTATRNGLHIEFTADTRM
jgi:hypothetical protein